MPEQKKPRSNTRNVVITIVLFAAVLLGAVYIGASQFAGDVNAMSTSIRIPVIRTELVSKTDGETHTVQTQFYVQVEKSVRKKITTELLTEALTEIMTTLDYDEIAGPSGVVYLNARTTFELNKYLENVTETRVYVTGLSTDDSVQLEDAPNNKQNDLMRGLFQNVN